jgi:hypothetical protein
MTRQDYLAQLFAEDADYTRLRAFLWEYQSTENPVVREYCRLLGNATPTFLPIRLFKDFMLKAGGDWQPQSIFESSGTTGQTPSRHALREPAIYERTAVAGFFRFFPKKNPQQRYHIFALLPNYLERGASSLVYMVHRWMAHFGTPESGFFLYDFAALDAALQQAAASDTPILLIGVTFALLDFSEQFPQKLPENAVVIETGGMKGRKEELTRTQLHALLRSGFGVTHVASEYGMTELTSQAYAPANGRFSPPPWLHVHISDLHLPDIAQPIGTTGRICLTDFANIDTCAFIATDDLGKLHPDGTFEVLGRIDTAEMRGCSLLYAG